MAKAKSLPKWEYRAGLISLDKFEELANDWGAEGWEIILGDFRGKAWVFVIMKRPVKA